MGGDWRDGLEPLLAPQSENDLDKDVQRRAATALEIPQRTNTDIGPRGKRGLFQVSVHPERLQSLTKLGLNLLCRGCLCVLFAVFMARPPGSLPTLHQQAISCLLTPRIAGKRQNDAACYERCRHAAEDGDVPIELPITCEPLLLTEATARNFAADGAFLMKSEV